MQNNESYTIEIANGWRKVFWHRKFFREQGFSFRKMAYGKSYYHMTSKSREECERYKEFCKKRGLKCRIYEKEYVRSSDYRKIFFEQQNYARKYTLCAYCGLPTKVTKLTVDHIIPVDKVKKTRKGRYLMKLFQIENVNEYRNLCGACKSCNSKKGRKMGLWVIRGFIGKNIPLWYARWAVRSAVVMFIILKALQFMNM